MDVNYHVCSLQIAYYGIGRLFCHSPILITGKDTTVNPAIHGIASMRQFNISIFYQSVICRVYPSPLTVYKYFYPGMSHSYTLHKSVNIAGGYTTSTTHGNQNMGIILTYTFPLLEGLYGSCVYLCTTRGITHVCVNIFGKQQDKIQLIVFFLSCI